MEFFPGLTPPETFLLAVFGTWALLTAMVRSIDNIETKEKEMNDKWTIFRDDNGKLLQTIYGYSNASNAATAHANDLNTKIGISRNQGPISYFEPTVATAWKRREQIREQAENMLEALKRIIDDLESQDMTVCDVNQNYAKVVIAKAEGN